MNVRPRPATGCAPGGMASRNAGVIRAGAVTVSCALCFAEGKFVGSRLVRRCSTPMPGLCFVTACLYGGVHSSSYRGVRFALSLVFVFFGSCVHTLMIRGAACVAGYPRLPCMSARGIVFAGCVLDACAAPVRFFHSGVVVSPYYRRAL